MPPPLGHRIEHFSDRHTTPIMEEVCLRFALQPTSQSRTLSLSLKSCSKRVFNIVFDKSIRSLIFLIVRFRFRPLWDTTTIPFHRQLDRSCNCNTAWIGSSLQDCSLGRQNHSSTSSKRFNRFFLHLQQSWSSQVFRKHQQTSHFVV